MISRILATETPIIKYKSTESFFTTKCTVINVTIETMQIEYAIMLKINAGRYVPSFGCSKDGPDADSFLRSDGNQRGIFFVLTFFSYCNSILYPLFLSNGKILSSTIRQNCNLTNNMALKSKPPLALPSVQAFFFDRIAYRTIRTLYENRALLCLRLCYKQK